jgi:endonuclease YncB( thermonuclease family)
MGGPLGWGWRWACALRAVFSVLAACGLWGHAALAQPAPAPHPKTATLSATVTSVQDGDSLSVRLAGRTGTQRVRLAGLDAPELRQPMGQASRESLRVLALRREVALTCHKQDRYERWVCRARLLPHGTDLSREQLLRGMAWQDRRHQAELPAATQTADAQAEALARQERRGVFSQPNPVPPWVWRRAERQQRG